MNQSGSGTSFAGRLWLLQEAGPALVALEKAVKENRAYAFPAGVWGAGGPKSNEEAIDAYVKILTGK